MSSVLNKVKDALHLNHEDDNVTNTPKSHGAHFENTNISEGTVGTDRQRFSHCDKTQSSSCQDASSIPDNYRCRKSTPETCTSNYVNNTPVTGPDNSKYHNSSLANKLDPRVESEISPQYGSTQGGRNSKDVITRAPSNVHYSSNTAPHQSDLLSKLDPRIDSNPTGYSNSHHSHGSVFTAPEDHDVNNRGKVSHPPSSYNSVSANEIDPRNSSYRY